MAYGFTRRTFIGWWLGTLMTATIVTAIAPLLVYIWPAPQKGQKQQSLVITLDKALNLFEEGDAVKFDAPTSPNSAFVMADGGGDNAAGDRAFGGFVSHLTWKLGSDPNEILVDGLILGS